MRIHCDEQSVAAMSPSPHSGTPSVAAMSPSPHFGTPVRKPALQGPKGVALILVMLAMLVLTVLAATIVFTARAETFASQNYKLDTQADYLAKAGIQRAINWFRSNHYQAASAAQATQYYKVTQVNPTLFPNLYTSDVSPVQCKLALLGGGCTQNAVVELIGYGNGILGASSSHFPSAITNASGTQILSAFPTDLATTGNTRLSADTSNSGYFKVTATLLNYQTVNVSPPYPWSPNPAPAACVTSASTVTCPVETWLISSKAYWTGGSSSTATAAAAEETAIIQPIYWPTWGNALYGFCSVSMIGSSGTCTDAFNSSLGPYALGNGSVASGVCNSTTTSNVISTGAGVGANGGVTLGSNVTVGGNVTIGSSPSAGCSASSGCQLQGGGQCTSNQVLGEVINGPHIDPPPLPTYPSGFPPGSSTNISLTGSSTATIPPAGLTPPWNAGPPSTSNSPYSPPTTYPPNDSTYCMTGYTCKGGTDVTLGSASSPYMIKNISLTGGTLTLVGGNGPLNPVYYDIECLSESGNGTIAISGYVVLNVQGTSCSGGNGLSITGNGISNGMACGTSPCTGIPPEAVVINYSGTSAQIGGNGAIAAVINAPNATVSLGGGGSGGYMVGSIQANNVDVSGGYPIHYDVNLSRVGGSMGTMVSTAYGRKKM